jgi:hypothetical protein
VISTEPSVTLGANSTMFLSNEKLNTIDAKSTITLSKTGSLGDELITDIKSFFKTLPSHIDTLILDNLDLPEAEAAINALHKHKNINKVGLIRLQPKAAKAAAYVLPNHVTHVTLEGLNTEAAKAVAQALPGQVTALVDSLSVDAKKVFKEVDDKGYLLLEPAQKGHYIIGLPCQNSTGDIYHVLSYLLLADAEGYKLPKVRIFGEKGEKAENIDTLKQAKRSKRLADLLGFAEEVTVVQVSGHGKWSNEREHNMLSDCADEKFINQKVTTSFLAEYMRHGNKYKRAIRLIRENLLKRIDSNEPKVHEDIQRVKKIVHQRYEMLSQEYIKEEHEAFMKSLEEGRHDYQMNGIVLIHIRDSKGANGGKKNDGQNFASGIIELIQEVLKNHNFFDWTFYCGDKYVDKNTFGEFKRGRSSVPAKTFDIFHDQALEEKFKKEEIQGIRKYEWYSKIYHILLLDRLQAHPSVRGIVGNTSGLLDMASLLGHDVLSVHNFKNREREYEFNAQDYRILSQYPFMSILAVPLKNGEDERKKKVKEQFEHWLNWRELHPSFYYHYFALSKFTSKEVKQLQSLLSEDWAQIKILKPCENLDYKELVLTIQEVIKLQGVLDNIGTVEAKKLSDKLANITKQFQQLPDKAPQKCSGYFLNDTPMEFDWFDEFHKALAKKFEEPEFYCVYSPMQEVTANRQEVTANRQEVTANSKRERPSFLSGLNRNKKQKLDSDMQNNQVVEEDANETSKQSTSLAYGS